MEGGINAGVDAAPKNSHGGPTSTRSRVVRAGLEYWMLPFDAKLESHDADGGVVGGGLAYLNGCSLTINSRAFRLL